MPTEAVTIDASALGKLLLDEDDSATFSEWYRQIRLAGIRMQSSPLLQFELGNILRRAFPRDKRNAALLEASLDGVSLVPVRAPSPFAFAPPLTYYDASYICSAQQTGALVSYDGRMTEVARRASVSVWDPGHVRGAIAPGFAAWVRRRHQDLVPPDIPAEASYLQTLAWPNRAPGHVDATALERAFGQFVQHG